MARCLPSATSLANVIDMVWLKRIRWVYGAAALFVVSWLGCSPGQGEPCAPDSGCAGGLLCLESVCRTADEAAELFQRRAERVEARHAARLAKEAKEVEALRLLAQSGVISTDQVERPPERPAESPTEAGPGTVRVSRTNGKAPIFAACRPDERLLAGGCRGLDTYVRISASYPSHYGATDTLGGRWNCDAQSTYVDKPLEAYALCQSTGAR